VDDRNKVTNEKKKKITAASASGLYRAIQKSFYQMAHDSGNECRLQHIFNNYNNVMAHLIERLLDRSVLTLLLSVFV
jgi:hypothetical protein